jgi:hypothetical protein
MTPYQMTDGATSPQARLGYMTLDSKHEVRSTTLGYEERFAITKPTDESNPLRKTLL